MCIEEEKKAEMPGGEPGDKEEYHGNYLNRIPSKAE